MEGARLSGDVHHQERFVEVDRGQVTAFAFDDFFVALFHGLADDCFEVFVQVVVFFLLGHGSVVWTVGVIGIFGGGARPEFFRDDGLGQRELRVDHAHASGVGLFGIVGIIRTDGLLFGHGV